MSGSTTLEGRNHDDGHHTAGRTGRHWLAAVAKAGTTEAGAVAATMRGTPVNDMNNTAVGIRRDGRVMCNMYLMQVKTPQESIAPFDVYTLVATLSGEQAFRPMAEGGCPLVT